jgi:hypothetical protein
MKLSYGTDTTGNKVCAIIESRLLELRIIMHTKQRILVPVT